MKFRFIFFAVSLISSTANVLFAQQNTIGFSGTVASGSAPSGNGPSNTPKTITFHQSQAVVSPPGTAYTPTTTVTFSLANQQFSSIEGNPSITGMEFGAIGNAGTTAAGNIPVGTPYWAALGTIFGGTYNNNYTGCNACTIGNSSPTATGDGVRYTTLGSIGAMLYTDALIQSNGHALPSILDTNADGQPNLLGKFYYGDLVITFNRPVSNPVLHIADIGGRVNYNTNISGAIVNYIQGFTTDYKLITPGLSLQKLSGTANLNVTADSISNTSTLFGSPSSGETYAGQSRASASGSIVIKGTNITSVTLRLTLRGDGGAIRNSTGTAGSAATATLGNYVQWAVQGGLQPCHGVGGCTPASGQYIVSGDYIQYAIGIERPVNVSGNVFHDINGGNVNSSSIVPIPAGIYANLVDTNGNVVASQLVPNTGGTAGQFSFTGISPDIYTVILTTTAGVQGTTVPATDLPLGWSNTGEFNGNPNTGNDGLINGISATFTVTTIDITNVNFGIQKTPESAFNLQPTILNPGTTISHAVPPSAFQNNNIGVTPNTQDYDGGTVDSIRIVSFPSNATSITINATTYTSATFPVSGVTVPYTNGVGPSQPILVDPIDGVVTVVIPFVSVDNAHSEDLTPGSVSIPFIEYGSIGNSVWVDSNANGVFDEGVTAGIANVKVYLLNSTSTIIDSVFTDVNGNYLFDSLLSGTYYVQFPTVQGGNVLTAQTATPQVDSNSDANTTTGVSPAVVINTSLTGQDKDNTTIDAGFTSYGSIGTYVWIDTNANGLFDESPSSGINGITIYLLDSSKNIIDSTVTANDGLGNPGFYIFPQLPTGVYYVQFPTSIGSGLTTQDSTAQTSGNSDPDATSGLSSAIAIDGFGSGVSRNNTTIFAGYLPASILAIEHINFVVNKFDNKNTLLWSINNLNNIVQFTVLKSVEASMEEIIGTVDVTNANSYYLDDKDVVNGNTGYRIIAHDIEGKKYSSSLKYIVRSDATHVTVFPNPAKNILQVKLNKYIQNDNGSISIQTISGKRFLSAKLQKGSSNTTLDISNLPNGVYVLVVSCDGRNYKHSFTKQ